MPDEFEALINDLLAELDTRRKQCEYDRESDTNFQGETMIPDYQTCMRPALAFLSDGATRRRRGGGGVRRPFRTRARGAGRADP